jgi:hypothetical protein
MASARHTEQHDVVFAAEALLRNVGSHLNAEIEVHAIAANETLARHTTTLLANR